MISIVNPLTQNGEIFNIIQTIYKQLIKIYILNSTGNEQT